MKTAIVPDPNAESFQDRRNYNAQGGAPGSERRQFTNTYEELSPEARELAQAIDSYKLMHRRRFITYEEMLSVVKSLGYGR
jgi:NTP pyrophosphatase (non-canonical NTP hydrolase)